MFKKFLAAGAAAVTGAMMTLPASAMFGFGGLGFGGLGFGFSRSLAFSSSFGFPFFGGFGFGFPLFRSFGFGFPFFGGFGLGGLGFGNWWW